LNGEAGFEPSLVDFAFGLVEWAGVLVVAGDKVVDVSFEFVDAAEGRTVQRLSVEDRKPDLDLVEP